MICFESFQDHRTDSVSLATLEKKCEARDLLSDHEYEKREKAKRVEMYSKQIAAGREIMYLPASGVAGQAKKL